MEQLPECVAEVVPGTCVRDRLTNRQAWSALPPGIFLGDITSLQWTKHLHITHVLV